MDTRKLGLIFLGISGFMIIIALMTFAIGGYNLENVDVEEKAIFKGVDGDLTVKKYDYYSVFVTHILILHITSKTRICKYLCKINFNFSIRLG